MRETRTLVVTLLVMAAIMLCGKYLRGDFTFETAAYIRTESEADRYVVSPDGIALININTVDAETLTRIDGIGKTLSERIIAYREEYGNFTSLDELLKVDGIGTKTLVKLKERLICLP